MTKAKDLKRENFDVTPDQQAAIETLQSLLDVPTKKDALLVAVQFTSQLVTEIRKGNHLWIGDADKQELTRFIMLGVERLPSPKWQYLVERPHPWKTQLYVKGRKLPAAVVWNGMHANKLTVKQAAENWDLPPQAIAEICAYCEQNQELLQMEAQEELHMLNERGIGIGSTPPPR